jgi:hypothetical protein
VGNLVISNVPGPATPLYIAGAKIASMYPCSIPFHGMAVNITVESYCDRLDVGLIACRRAMPDVARLADGLAGALAELQRAAARALPVAVVQPPPPIVVDRAASPAPRSGGAVALVEPSNGKSRSAGLPA